MTTIKVSECDLCSSADFVEIGEIDQRRIVRCGSCGLVFASEYSPEWLEDAYKNDYYASPTDDRISKWRSDHLAVWKGLCNDLTSRTKREIRKVLDIGAGSGGFLCEARRHLPDAELWAVEKSSAAAGALRGLGIGLRVECSDFADATLNETGFDVVAMLQTLEHVPEPGRILRLALDKLAPEGILLITVPNRGSLMVRIKGLKEKLCMANLTHLYFFDDTIMRRYMVEAGFIDTERVVRWGERGSFLGNAAQYCARRAALSSELRYVAYKRKG